MPRTPKLLAFLIPLIALFSAPPAAAGTLELVTRVPPRMVSGTGGGESWPVSLSRDGRWLAFLSRAPNLLPGQTARAGSVNVFLYDRVSGATTLVSHRADDPGVEANRASWAPMLSGDGRFLIFSSSATDLVAGVEDSNQGNDVFLYDRVTGKTSLVSGSEGKTLPGPSDDPALSADGRWAVFFSGQSILLFDRIAGRLQTVGGPEARIWVVGYPLSISADGRRVVFLSYAEHLVPGQVDINQNKDVFLYDRLSGTTTLVSHAASSPTKTGNRECLSAAVSADGSTVVYRSRATNLVPGQNGPPDYNLFLFDVASGRTSLVNHASSSLRTAADASQDHRGGNFAISADGSWVAFDSGAIDLVAGQTEERSQPDVFLYHRADGGVRLLSGALGSATRTADGESGILSISADGSRVLFYSGGTNLAEPAAGPSGGTRLYLYDRRQRRTSLFSPALLGRNVSGGYGRTSAQLSGDGRWVSYPSDSIDLVAGARDFNQAEDVVLDNGISIRELVSLRAPGSRESVTPAAISFAPALSADGRYVMFVSYAEHLLNGQRDSNQATDVFVRDRVTGTTVLASHAAGQPRAAANGESYGFDISPDGRWILMTSTATNLVPGQTGTNGQRNVFLFDRATGATRLVSHVPSSPVTAGNGGSWMPRLTADGSYAVFLSSATDLAAGGPDPGSFYGHDNVFLYELASGAVTLVSRAPATGAWGSGDSDDPSPSADGRFIAFISDDMGLVSGAIEGNGSPNVLLYDRAAGSMALVSRSASSPTLAVGGERPRISADGRYVYFTSWSQDLVPGQSGSAHALFLFDRVLGTAVLVSHAAGSPTVPAEINDYQISPDGRYVAFTSSATDLVPGQEDPDPYSSDLFLFDRVSGRTVLLSHKTGSPTRTTDCGSSEPWVSPDGRVAFVSCGSDLVPGQHRLPETLGSTNAQIFLYDRPTDTVSLISHAMDDPTLIGSGAASEPVFSADGRVLAFSSSAYDLVPSDLNLRDDVFVYLGADRP
jgi:Tol biopolymer transport system component